MKPLLIKEQIPEIINTLRAHKLRTFLTAFGIIWGIFILVVMLGVSGGVKEGVFKLFEGFTRESVWIYGGEEKENMNMRETGRRIYFEQHDLEAINNFIPGKVRISPEVVLTGIPVTPTYDDDQGWFQFKGVGEDYFSIKGIEVKIGRPLNEKDIKDKRQVIVIGDRVVRKYFRNANPVGHELIIREHCFTIVGVLDDKSFFAMNEQNSIFIPVTSMNETIEKVDLFPSFGILIQNLYAGYGLERIKDYLANRYYFDKNDPAAIYIINYKEQLSAFSKFFNGFDIFLLFVGCCLLLSGIIGISNIMYHY